MLPNKGFSEQNKQCSEFQFYLFWIPWVLKPLKTFTEVAEAKILIPNNEQPQNSSAELPLRYSFKCSQFSSLIVRNVPC